MISIEHVLFFHAWFSCYTANMKRKDVEMVRRGLLRKGEETAAL
jgi:hypothetical protein